jgi:hypothetical protein
MLLSGCCFGNKGNYFLLEDFYLRVDAQILATASRQNSDTNVGRPTLHLAIELAIAYLAIIYVAIVGERQNPAVQQNRFT